MKGPDIRRLREQLNLSQEEVAREVGTSQQSIQRIETGETKVSQYTDRIIDFLNRVSMASVSDVPPTRSPLADVIAHEFIRAGALPNEYPSSIPYKVPVIAIEFAAVEIYSFDTKYPPIDYINRPHPLTFSPRGYAIYIIGTDMVPELRPGETALVNPDIPPMVGELHVLSSDINNFGKKYFMFGILKGQDPEGWTIDRNEKRLPKISRDEFPFCERIVGKFSRR